MDIFAPRHLLIILLIALVVFGGKKLRTLGPDLGAAIRGFKKAMNDEAPAEDMRQLTSASTPPKEPGAT